MGKNGHPRIPDLRYRAAVGSPPGAEVLNLADLPERARRHGNDPYRPKRPAFHQLLAVRGGSCTVTVDFTAHRLGAGDWLWIRPGQVQQWGTDLAHAQGLLVLFEPGFLDAGTLRAAAPGLPYTEGPTRLSGARARGVERALDHVLAEYADLPELPVELYLRTLRHLVSVLVLRLGAVLGEQRPEATPTTAFVRFHDAVERDFATTRRVDEYAAALGYNPRTLTRATMAAAGVTAKKYIDDRVLLEAKRLLAHDTDSAAAVARTLGFADPSDFTKFFRVRTGTTPAAFRAAAQGL